MSGTVYPAISPSKFSLVQAIKAAGIPARNAVRAAAELGVSMSRGLIPTVLFALSAVVFFGLGSLLAARHAATSDNEQIAALRAEVGALKRQGAGMAGTSGRIEAVPAMDDHSRAALVADIKQQLKSEMGLTPVSLLRERRQ